MKSDALWLADMGDGTYRNPVLFCDYSDPDVIRVGDTYYLTASSFNYVPGLPILTSRDLVNWELKNYALKNIPEYASAAPKHARGVWAPAIRWHDGYFMIFYGMPDEGIFMVRARDALGEWEPPVCVLPGKGLIDPCPFWDDDGTAVVVHGYAKSRIGFKSVLGIFPISADGTRATGPDRILYDGRVKHPTMEGPKVHKRDGWYIILTPAGGVATGWQVMLRSRKLMGPYEDRVVLKQGSTQVNGPHQGAWVETPEGESWFLHFQSRGLYGRIVHLQPMTWGEDGWPMLGVADAHPVDPASIPAGEDAAEASLLANAADCGVPVIVHRKPSAPACAPQPLKMADGFDADRPALQWQFMGNWREDFYAIEQPGMLRLYARTLSEGGDRLWQCPQAMTQKIAGPSLTAQTALDARHLHPGEQAGLAVIGGQAAYVAIRRTEDGFHLVYVETEGAAHGESVLDERALSSGRAVLRVTIVPTGYAEGEAVFELSEDGARFEKIGRPFSPSRHTWVGARLGLFAMPLCGKEDEGGFARFGAFDVWTEED